jgi:hypothetical protein
MMKYYREIYGLNGQMKEVVKEISDIKGVDIYTVLPFDMGFVEMSAPSETEIKHFDQKVTSRILSFCEQNKIEKHLLGPLEML